VGQRTTGETYYEFETITLCFYDKRLMDLSMLTADEITWIDDYHHRVATETLPRLNDEEKAFLADKCKPIEL